MRPPGVRKGRGGLFIPDDDGRPSGGYCCCVARPGEALTAIPLETRHFEDLGRYLFEPMIARLSEAEMHAGDVLGGRTVWMVNSTAVGRWVAQMRSYAAALLERRGDRRPVDGATRFCRVLPGDQAAITICKASQAMETSSGSTSWRPSIELPTTTPGRSPRSPRRRGRAERPPDGGDVGAARAGWRERHLELPCGHRPRQRVLSERVEVPEASPRRRPLLRL